MNPTKRAFSIDNCVLESCFIDLWVDEEESEDLEIWARKNGWYIPFSAARKRIREIRPAGKTYWPQSPITRSDKEFSNLSQVAQCFLNMKAARARVSLDCNRTRYQYAQQSNGYKSESVVKTVRIVRNTLDEIIMDSLRAFGSISPNPKSLKGEWRVLAALFHSEVCASGPTEDMSYGMARAFEVLFRPGRKLPWRWLFQLVATHNQGRGWSHQGNHVQCIRLLEPFLEDFGSKVERRKYLSLAKRLVYFPAAFTLVESLKDCHRTTEAARWLRLAQREVGNQSLYWKSRIDIELSILRVSRTPFEPDKPRLMNEYQRWKYVNKEEKLISNKQSTEDLECDSEEWAKALAWTIRWHEGDRFNLLGTIQGVAQSVQAVSAALAESLNEKNYITYAYCLNNIMKALKSLRQAIKSNSKYAEFKFLAPEKESTALKLKMREGISMWRPLKLLMPALHTTNEFRKRLNAMHRHKSVLAKSDNLEQWWKILKWRLERARERKYIDGKNLFVDVASDQEVYELLKNEIKLCSSKKHRKKNCNKFPNCAEVTLRLGDLRRCKNKKIPQEDDFKVASTAYLLNRMSRTDAEFIRFLEKPSSELRSHSIDPITPWTEFISLRRWNSFSPNLASRATTTVGGGYLIRVWSKDLDGLGEYTGIAIDPGYNYLENLFNEGFTLPDLHIIVITHAHPDHVENLSNILTLLRERNKRVKEISRVFLVLTEGVFQRFKTMVDNEMDFIDDVVVLSWVRENRNTVNVVRRRDLENSGRKISLTMDANESSPLASITAIKAIHHDGTEFDAMGVVVKVMNQRERGGKDILIGFTGDSRYWEEQCNKGKFTDCDVLVPHLGSVIGSKAFKDSHEDWRLCAHDNRLNRALKELQNTLNEKNHLYLPGISMLLCDLTNALRHLKRQPERIDRPLILLSEFGEELRGGLRADLAKRLENVFKIRILPVDVGLRVGVEDLSVRCSICRQYVSARSIRPVAVTDEDEALEFVCDDCYRSRQHELPMLLNRLRKMPLEHHPTNVSEGPKGSESGERPDAERHPPRQS